MSKAIVQFAHANGFPARTYSHLFGLLEEFDFRYVDRMGHGDFPLDGDVNNFADELIAFMENSHDQPVIGVGHSTGGDVITLAACRRPELFNHVVLLDPVLFSRRKRWLFWALKKLGMADRIGPASRAARRRSTFASRDEAADYLRNRPLFQNFHPECFLDYIRYGLQDSADGVELAFSREVEAEVFRNPLIRAPAGLRKLSGILIYGEHSSVFERSDANWWRRNVPKVKIIPFDGAHLFPLEQPAETAELLRDLLLPDQGA